MLHSSNTGILFPAFNEFVVARELNHQRFYTAISQEGNGFMLNLANFSLIRDSLP